MSVWRESLIMVSSDNGALNGQVHVAKSVGYSLIMMKNLILSIGVII